MLVAKPFRAEDWWIGKASLLIGLVYLFAIYFQVPFESFGLWACCSLVTIIGFASFGYLVNDRFDLEKDKLANKKNFLLHKSAFQQAGYFSIAMLLLLAPWHFLPYTIFTIALMVIQLLLYLLYSLPGIRLKERGLWGLITDALYAHCIPALMAAHTYALISKRPLTVSFIVLLFVWQFCVGIRNILLHQLNDSDADQLSYTQTFTNKYNMNASNQFLTGLRTTELAFLLLFIAILYLQNHWFLISLLGIGLSLLLFFSMDKNNGYRFYFPNLLYDHLLPLSYIAILSISDNRFLLLLPVQLFLFSGKWLFTVIAGFQLGYRWNKIINSSSRAFHVMVANIKRVVNKLIYFLFKGVGVDLIKEETDAKGYILRQLNKRK